MIEQLLKDVYKVSQDLIKGSQNSARICTNSPVYIFDGRRLLESQKVPYSSREKVATAVLMDVFLETPVHDRHSFYYDAQITAHNLQTWPQTRRPNPIFKPHFDEHWTPVSKYPSKELPSQLLARELSPMSSNESRDDTTTKQTTPVRPTSYPPEPPSPIPLTPNKSHSSKQTTPLHAHSTVTVEKSSPRSCFLPMSTNTDVLVSERIALQRETSPRDSATASDATSQPDSPTTPKKSLEQEEDEFWLAPAVNRIITLRHLTAKRHPRRFDRPSKPIKFPITLGLKEKDNASDDASQSSYSVVSDDSPPRSPPPRVERLTLAKETAFFNEIHEIISDAFDLWEVKLKEKGLGLSKLQTEDRFVELPDLFEKDVLMGKRPDENGFWTGGFRLRGRRTFLHRLLNKGRENLWGFECGWIDDFECRTYAVLLMGTDRMVYYYDADGDVEEDEDGRLLLPRSWTI